MIFIKNKLFPIKQTIIRLGLCVMTFSLSACVNDDVSDLHQYVKAVKARPKGIIRGLPEMKVVEPFIFNPEGLRDPFYPIEKKLEESLLGFATGTGIQPDRDRRKEELESYSLDTLRMVGTLTMQKQLWALIKANEGTIHRVKEGNHMGKNYGEIIRILDDRVELMEIVPDKNTKWREQQAALVLSE